MAEVPRKKAPSSRPPPVPSDVPEPLESSWDDDTTPRFELDDPMSESAFDRVTAIPELPSELLAKQLMSEEPEPASSPEHATPPGSEPPRVSVRALAPLEASPPPSAPAPPRGSALASTVPPPERPTRPAEPERHTQITEMKDRYAMGDFTGALAVAESMLDADADDLDAQRYAQTCRDVLTQMYTARLGALSQHVRVAVPVEQIRWLSLDHRAGFVLSLIDGSSTVEELLDISGMNRLDALRILYTLFDQRVIALG